MKSIYFIFLLLILAFASKAQSFDSIIAAWQTQYKSDLVSDLHSPLSADDTATLQFYKSDTAYCVWADIIIFNQPQHVLFATSSTKTKTFDRFAQLDFVLNEQAFTLIVFQSEVAKDSNYLFLPFADASCGNTSYGGGRYIDLDKQTIKNGKIRLDFNKAYNPYCAYATGYACPLPPVENILPIEIIAGEKVYTGRRKKKPGN